MIYFYFVFFSVKKALSLFYRVLEIGSVILFVLWCEICRIWQIKTRTSSIKYIFSLHIFHLVLLVPSIFIFFSAVSLWMLSRFHRFETRYFPRFSTIGRVFVKYFMDILVDCISGCRLNVWNDLGKFLHTYYHIEKLQGEQTSDVFCVYCVAGFLCWILNSRCSLY